MVSVYNRARANEEILSAHSKSPASLTVHLYHDYWRFNQSGNCLYHTPIAALLEDIRARRVPVDFLDIFIQARVPFYEGCLIVELFDHREPSTSTDTVKPQRVVLHPTAETAWADLSLMNARNGGTWTDREALEIESRLLLQTTPELCLDPDPIVTRIANAALRASTPSTPAPFKRKRMTDDTELEEEKAQRDKFMKMMNPRADRGFHAPFRLLDVIQRHKSQRPNDPQAPRPLAPTPQFRVPPAPPSTAPTPEPPQPIVDEKPKIRISKKNVGAAKAEPSEPTATITPSPIPTTINGLGKKKAPLGKKTENGKSPLPPAAPLPTPVANQAAAMQAASALKKGGKSTPVGIGKPSDSQPQPLPTANPPLGYSAQQIQQLQAQQAQLMNAKAGGTANSAQQPQALHRGAQPFPGANQYPFQQQHLQPPANNPSSTSSSPRPPNSNVVGMGRTTPIPPQFAQQSVNGLGVNGMPRFPTATGTSTAAAHQMMAMNLAANNPNGMGVNMGMNGIGGLAGNNMNRGQTQSPRVHTMQQQMVAAQAHHPNAQMQHAMEQQQHRIAGMTAQPPVHHQTNQNQNHHPNVAAALPPNALNFAQPNANVMNMIAQLQRAHPGMSRQAIMASLQSAPHMQGLGNFGFAGMAAGNMNAGGMGGYGAGAGPGPGQPGFQPAWRNGVSGAGRGAGPVGMNQQQQQPGAGRGR